MFEGIQAIFCAFHPYLGNDDGSRTWLDQRDLTEFISEFERLSFTKRKTLIYVPVNKFITTDDELVWTRSKHNPLKTIYERKADREGL